MPTITPIARGTRDTPPWYVATMPDPWTPLESGGPSAHLTWEMLACLDPVAKSYTPYPDIYRTTRVVPLAAAWEATVAWTGTVPVIYRAYWDTAAMVEILASFERGHLHGTALDIGPGPGQTLDALYESLAAAVRGHDPTTHRRQSSIVGWRRVVHFGDHLHVDVAGRAYIGRTLRCAYPPRRHGAPLYRVA